MEKLIELYGETDAKDLYEKAVITFCWCRSETSGSYAIDAEDIWDIYSETMDKLDARAKENLSDAQYEKRTEETDEHGEVLIWF